MQKINFKQVLLLTASAAMLLLSSCEKPFLEKPLDDYVPLGESFEDIRNARNWINNIYNDRVNEYTLLGNAGFSAASDEAIHGSTTNTSRVFYNGSWTSLNTPFDIWTKSFTTVRKINVFFENIKNVVVIQNEDTVKLSDDGFANAYFLLERLKGEAFFLRAYNYIEMFKYYGAVPIVTRSYGATEDFNLPRNTVDEVVAFIKKDLDSAMKYLPENYANFYGQSYANWQGRAVKATCLAYKAKAQLLYASPLHNPTNDLGRWRDAAELYGRFISTYAATYGLETQVQRAFMDPNSKEAIFNIRAAAGSSTIDRNQRPAGFKFFTGPAANPSQDLVDAFQMRNGKSITDATSTYNAARPYENRDPRFYQFINFNGATLLDNPTASTWSVRQVETFNGGKDAQPVVNATRTGYYVRKFMDTTLNLVSNQTSFRPYVLMRYPEVLLSYAEAVNEAYGPYASSTASSLKASAAVEQIRQRAGLIPFALSTTLTQAQMRDAIVQERRIELAFENQRFWDARRWKKAEQWFNVPARGVQITKTGTTTFTYKYVDVETKTFTAKMNFFPIPDAEIRYNPKMKQNPGW